MLSRFLQDFCSQWGLITVFCCPITWITDDGPNYVRNPDTIISVDIKLINNPEHDNLVPIALS